MQPPSSTQEPQGTQPTSPAPAQPKSVEARGRRWSSSSNKGFLSSSFKKETQPITGEPPVLSGPKQGEQRPELKKEYTEEDIEELKQNPRFGKFLAKFVTVQNPNDPYEIKLGLELLAVNAPQKAKFFKTLNDPENKATRELLGILARKSGAKQFTEGDIQELKKNPNFGTFLIDFLEYYQPAPIATGLKPNDPRDIEYGLGLLGIGQGVSTPQKADFLIALNDPNNQAELLGTAKETTEKKEVEHVVTTTVPKTELAKRITMIGKGLGYALKTAFTTMHEKVSTVLASDMEKTYKEWGGEKTARQLMQAFATSPEAGNKALEEFLTTGKVSPQPGKLPSLKTLLRDQQVKQNFTTAIGFHQSLPTDLTSILKEIAESRTILQKPVKEQEEARKQSWLVRTLVGSTQTGVTGIGLRREATIHPRTLKEGEGAALERYKNLKPGESTNATTGHIEQVIKATKKHPGNLSQEGLKVLQEYGEQRPKFLEKYTPQGSPTKTEINDWMNRTSQYFETINPGYFNDPTAHTMEEKISGASCAVTHITGKNEKQQDAHTSAEISLGGEKAQCFAIFDGHGDSHAVAFAANWTADHLGQALETAFHHVSFQDLTDEQKADRFSSVGAILENKLEEARTQTCNDFTALCESIKGTPFSPETDLEQVCKKYGVQKQNLSEFLKNKADGVTKIGSLSNKVNAFLQNPPDPNDAAAVDTFLQKLEILSQLTTFHRDLTSAFEEGGLRKGTIDVQGSLPKIAENIISNNITLSKEELNKLDKGAHTIQSLKSGTMMTSAVRVGNEVYTINIGDARVTIGLRK